MRAMLKREGDVFTVQVPATMVEASGLQDGAEVDVVVRHNGLSLLRRPRITLDTILEELRMRGPPPPLEWPDDPPRGSEVW